MSVFIRAIECFVLAIFFGVLPFALGYALGWIMKGEHDDTRRIQGKAQENSEGKSEETQDKS